jgi:hypothetical protein
MDGSGKIRYHKVKFIMRFILLTMITVEQQAGQESTAHNQSG